MEKKKYKLGELAQVTKGASLKGDYYATQGNSLTLIRRLEGCWGKNKCTC